MRRARGADNGTTTTMAISPQMVRKRTACRPASILALPTPTMCVVCLSAVSHTCRARGADNGSATTTAISPQVVREAMKQRASHWGAMRQEDAHEFFTALLNALADEAQQAQVGGGA